MIDARELGLISSVFRERTVLEFYTCSPLSGQWKLIQFKFLGPPSKPVWFD